MNSKTNNNQYQLRDVEMVYEKATKMIQRLKEKYKLITKIRLIESDKAIFQELAQGISSVIDLLKRGGEVQLIFQNNLPYFQVQLELEMLIIPPEKMKEQLLKKQLFHLNQRNIFYQSKECRDHNIAEDFINTDDDLKKDECNELLKERFDCFKVQDEQTIIDILKKYLKKNLIETYNKELIDIRFYINQDLEIVIEYKINDNQLSLSKKVKRRKWSEIKDSISQFYNYQQFQEITQSMIEQMFVVDEIEFQELRQCIQLIVQNCKSSYNQNFKQPLQISKSKYWDILGILPRSFNTFKRFGECKILIIQNQNRLFFLNHQKIIQNQLIQYDTDLFQTYTELINNSIQRLEQIKKDVSENNTQSLIKLVRYKIQLIEKLEIVPEIEQEIIDLQIQEKQLLDQLIDETDSEFILFHQHQMSQDIYQQAQPITEKIKQYISIYKEYQRVLNKVKYDVINFKGFKIVQQNKIFLTNQYKRVLQEKQRLFQKLPIYFKKRELINSIQQSQVILLIGSTGSGKSTQLVQYVYEEIELKKKIICVEPRMIAARSLAKRVAEEMFKKLGGCVAYLNEFDQLEDDNKIIFTQDRIILNILQKDPLLSDYEIVIIDEAHERNMNTDILLGLLKDILNQRNDLKLIIMSATMDEQLFSNYFQCETFKVEGNLFSVKIKYQDSFQDNYLQEILKLIEIKIINKVMNQTYRQKHVLVFLAGVDEIQFLLSQFQHQYHDMDEFLFLGLHGQMTTDEQFNVFQETKKIKIIFTTRVAETSLTINDVSLVIDIGVDRFQEFDQRRGMQITKINWISQAQANQRAGRAGRTRPGKCYRLYSETEFQTQMQEHKKPEIQRCCLDLVVLRIKSFNKDPFQFQFIQSPDTQAMKNSQEYLIDIKALDEQGNITVLGKFMSQIQTEPRMSRILIEAFYRNVFRETLSIICVMLNNQSLYLKNTDISNKIDVLHEMGDFFTYSRIYWDYIELINSNYETYQIRKICQEKGYHYKTLKNCEKTFDEMEKAFSYFSQQLYDNQQIKNNMIEASREERVMMCFLTAYYPDLCVYNGTPYIGYTFMKSKRNVRIYGTCTLSLLNHFPKFIICSDLYSSNYFDFCKVAQEVKLEQLKEILKPDQIEAIEKFVPNQYHYQQLQNVSSSMLNHLLHTFSKSSYDEKEKRFKHYCNLDSDKGLFEIWSLTPVDLELCKRNYYDKIKHHLYFRLYGQGMLVYFRHGGEIHDTQQCAPSELLIIQFTTSPLNIEEIQQILDEQNLQYKNLSQINVNQFGYSGQIFTNSYETATKIIEVLNQKAQEKLDQYEQREKQDYQKFFTIQPREIRNRVIKSSVELIFYGCQNKGFGFVQFNNDQEAEEFLLATLGLIKFRGLMQDVKLKSQEQKSQLRISNVQPDANEYQLLKYLQDLARQSDCPIPSKLHLIAKEQAQEKDWQDEINNLFKKYTKELPYHLDIRPDKSHYRILVRVMTWTNPIKLEEMRREINFANNILGYSSVTMKIEYKIIKLISKYVLDLNEEKINIIKNELSKKYSDDLLKIISPGDNMILIGKNPNIVRLASLMLHGVLTGYIIKIDLKKHIFKQLLKDDQFYEDLLSLQNLHGFKYNIKQLQYGKIKVYLNQDSLIKIQKAIKEIIQQKVSRSLIINVRNYSFKPLLSIKDNILFMLQNQYQVQIDFILQKKQVIIYGNNEQAQKCKEKLLQLLSKSTENQIQSECEICCCEITEKYILALCNHSFCKDCLQESIKVSTVPYKCPQQSCGNTISLDDLQQILCEIEFSKLLDQNFKRYKDEHGDEYTGCITPDCEEFFKKLPKNKEQFYYCQSCLQSFCLTCKRNAHPQISCEEAKKLYILGKDLDDEELLKMNIKKCPKCQMGVQKNEGCLHLTCKICSNHFCWVCLHQADNADDIYAHLKSVHGNIFEEQ